MDNKVTDVMSEFKNGNVQIFLKISDMYFFFLQEAPRTRL